eukprot:6206171-Pleurochrysis_carterae.AAC.5
MQPLTKLVSRANRAQVGANPPDDGEEEVAREVSVSAGRAQGAVHFARGHGPLRGKERGEEARRGPTGSKRPRTLVGVETRGRLETCRNGGSMLILVARIRRCHFGRATLARSNA